jgi:hypothetical protein
MKGSIDGLFLESDSDLKDGRLASLPCRELPFGDGDGECGLLDAAASCRAGVFSQPVSDRTG